MKISFLTIILWSKTCFSLNLISNYSFESPVVSAVTNKGYVYQQATGWTGYCFEVIQYQNNLGFGQYVDLQGATGINGYIQQNVTLANDSSCVLTFYQKAWNTNFSSFVMEVSWNGVILATKMANVTTPTFETLTMIGQAGVNNLKFTEIGDKTDYVGMFIDELNLTCQAILTNTTTLPVPGSVPTESYKEYVSKTLSSAIAVVSALPINHAVMMRYLFMYAGDLWLYHYDKDEYEGNLNLVFSVIAEIEKLKFQIINQVANVDAWRTEILKSNYTPYTRERFVKIEQSSTLVLDTLFSFFVYAVPQNFLTTVVVCVIFKKIRNSQVSRHFRKFYFVKTAIVQTLLEGNVAYFTYVCFGNLQLAFSFCPVDRLALVLAVLLLWAIVLFCLGFYPLIGRYLRKHSGYFIYCVYRCNPGYCFLHIKVVFRSFLQGAVFFFLHEYYELELLWLGLIEVAVIVATLALQQWKKVFINKLFFCMMLGYHFLFLLFNLVLYFGYLCNHVESYGSLKELSLYFQNLSLFLLIGQTVLTMVLDALPLEWLKKFKFDFSTKSQTKVQLQLPKKSQGHKIQKHKNHKHKEKQFNGTIARVLIFKKNELVQDQPSKSKVPQKMTLKAGYNLSKSTKNLDRKPTTAKAVKKQTTYPKDHDSNHNRLKLKLTMAAKSTNLNL